MTMNWPVVSVIIVALNLQIENSQQTGTPTARGSCASINYSHQCCPPSTDVTLCNATDGDCRCDTECHRYEECCSDHSCVPDPITCEDTGIRECCTDSISRNCKVFNADGEFVCSCSALCHENGDCCPDAAAIGCKPSCSPSKEPGCCKWRPSSSCYVRGNVGDGCYCDSYCIVFGDCCRDVQLPTCTATLSTWSGRNIPETQSHLQQDLLHAARTQQYYNNMKRPSESVVRTQQYDLKRPWAPLAHFGYYDHHRMALAARMERMHTNAREFRGRARARVADRPPTQYNYNDYY